MNNEILNTIQELTLDELVKNYKIIDEKEYDVLKEGKHFIDSALEMKDEKSNVRVGSALIEYMLYKMNGGK